MKILLTGGAGFIGSHTCIELMKAGHEVLIYDNLSNSSSKVLERLERITNSEIKFIQNDIQNFSALKDALVDNKCESVIHFAGLKSVAESVKEPIKYYKNNVNGTINLLSAMQATGVKKIIFSSSATVYGSPNSLPIKEEHKLNPTNPYGKSKWIVENILNDLYFFDTEWEIGILRYFNPVGAHKSGLIGENPIGSPTNLMPLLAKVAIGEQKELNIWGNDFPTIDGTGVRDYIHVVDIAVGHLKTLENLTKKNILTFNLGSGKGFSVLEVIKTFEKVSGTKIPYQISSRRDGDHAILYADPSKATKKIGWQTNRSLEEICEDYWRWQIMNPNGY